MPTFKLAWKTSLHENPVVGTSFNWNTGYVAEDQDDTEHSQGYQEREADTSEGEQTVQGQHQQEKNQGSTRHIAHGEVHDTNIIACVDVNGQPIIAETYGGEINEGVVIADNHASERKPGDIVMSVKKKKKEDDDDEAGEGDVPDGGWGYLVVIGCFISMIFIVINGSCFAFLYSDFLLKLKTSSAIVGWIYSVQFIMINLAKPLTASLVEVLGWRRSMFGGGILLGIGTCLSSFATSAAFLFFSHSLLTGIAIGVSRLIIQIIVPAYFKRRRGRAIAFAVCGGSVGAIVGPLLVTFLQEKFGYQGATLIMGALTFNVCVAAAVFHPVEWHTRPLTRAKAKSEDRKLSTRPVVVEKLNEIIRTMAKDLMIIKSRQAIIISIGCTIATGSCIQISVMVPFLMKAQGFPQTEASWCMSLASICNLVASLMASFLTDCSWFNIRACYMTGFIIMAGSILAYSFVTSLALTGVVLGVWGFGAGICLSLFPFIIIRFLGLKKLSPVLGLAGLFNCAFFLCIGPLLGVIADVTGSYRASLLFIDASFVLAFILWIFMPAAVAYDHRAEAQGINLRKTTIE